MKKMFLFAVATILISGSVYAQQMQPQPAMKTKVIEQNTTTTYDVTTKNKKGITQYGMTEQTQTTPQHGTQLISQTEYADYTPSEMALANDKLMQVSVGMGGTYSFAKDSYGARLSNIGMAATGQVLWDMMDHLAVGVDYMMLLPQKHTNHRGGDYKYSDFRVHNIALAGKYTINAWDRFNFYLPMGVGAAQVHLKGAGTREGVNSVDRDEKWGLGLFGGVGMQYNFTPTLFMGLEYRYNVAFVKSEDLNPYGKDSTLRFHNAFLRVGMRF